jgi:hypothetical protein
VQLCIVTLSLLALTACSPMKNGLVDIEGRGALSGEVLAVGAAVVFAGPGSHTFDSDHEDVETLGWGVQAAVNSPAIDLIGGFDERVIHHESVPEVSVGLRKRFGPIDTPLYVFALARSSRSDTSSDDVFNGSALGLGLFVQAGKHWFIDTNIAWEHTNDISIENGDEQIDEAIFQFGIGWSF